MGCCFSNPNSSDDNRVQPVMFGGLSPPLPFEEGAVGEFFSDGYFLTAAAPKFVRTTVLNKEKMREIRRRRRQRDSEMEEASVSEQSVSGDSYGGVVSFRPEIPEIGDLCRHRRSRNPVTCRRRRRRRSKTGSFEGDEKLENTGRDSPPLESLENPVVSMECFIFL